MHLNAYELSHTIHFELKTVYLKTKKESYRKKYNYKIAKWKFSHCGESDLKANFCWYLISKPDVDILINSSQKYNQ